MSSLSLQASATEPAKTDTKGEIKMVASAAPPTVQSSWLKLRAVIREGLAMGNATFKRAVYDYYKSVGINTHLVAVMGKNPIYGAKWQSATDAHINLERYLARDSSASELNFGFRMNEYFALDFDRPELMSAESLAKLAAAIANDVSMPLTTAELQTWATRSPGGGHRIFSLAAVDQGVRDAIKDIKNVAGEHSSVFAAIGFSDIDIRGWHTQIVAPGSFHRCVTKESEAAREQAVKDKGKFFRPRTLCPVPCSKCALPYDWLEGHEPDVLPCLPPPPALVAYLQKHAARSLAAAVHQKQKSPKSAGASGDQKEIKSQPSLYVDYDELVVPPDTNLSYENEKHREYIDFLLARLPVHRADKKKNACDYHTWLKMHIALHGLGAPVDVINKLYERAKDWQDTWNAENEAQYAEDEPKVRARVPPFQRGVDYVSILLKTLKDTVGAEAYDAIFKDEETPKRPIIEAPSPAPGRFNNHDPYNYDDFARKHNGVVYESLSHALSALQVDAYKVVAVVSAPFSVIVKTRPPAAYDMIHGAELPLAGANNIKHLNATQAQKALCQPMVRYRDEKQRVREVPFFSVLKNNVHRFPVHSATMFDARVNFLRKHVDPSVFNQFPGFKARLLPADVPVNRDIIESFIDHVGNGWANGNEEFAWWLHIFFYKLFTGERCKKMVGLFTQLQQAGGKGMLMKFIQQRMLGPAIAKSLAGVGDLLRNFNEFVAHTVLLFLDDVHNHEKQEHVAAYDIVKHLVTETVTMTHKKFSDSEQTELMTNIIMSTNWSGAFKIYPGDRRIGIQQTAEFDADYFDKLAQDLLHPDLPDHLLTFYVRELPKKKKFAEMLAKYNANVIPQTEFRTSVMSDCLSQEQRFVREILTANDGKGLKYVIHKADDDELLDDGDGDSDDDHSATKHYTPKSYRVTLQAGAKVKPTDLYLCFQQWVTKIGEGKYMKTEKKFFQGMKDICGPSTTTHGVRTYTLPPVDFDFFRLTTKKTDKVKVKADHDD